MSKSAEWDRIHTRTFAVKLPADVGDQCMKR